jgi:hypothetical protein
MLKIPRALDGFKDVYTLLPNMGIFGHKKDSKYTINSNWCSRPQPSFLTFLPLDLKRIGLRKCFFRTEKRQWVDDRVNGDRRQAGRTQIITR